MLERVVVIGAVVFPLLAAPVAAQYPVARIDSVFSRWNRTDSPGCLLGVRERDREPLVRAYGMANLEYAVPLSPESVSESGSVAKQFTSAAVALLAVRGRLSLDDDIRKYLPEVPDFGKTITIRHILTHTSGLRDQWALLGLIGRPPGTEVHTVDQILDLVSRQKRLNFDPGSAYLYSNAGYVLAGIIVKRVSGKSLAEFSAEELFKPLGMTHTAWRDDYRRVVRNRATAYSPGEGGSWVQDMPFTMVHGNGGLLSSIGDLLIWNEALSSGRIPGGKPMVDLLEERAKLNDGTLISYALGLVHDDYHGVHEIGHGGATAGYRTYLARFPERGLSVAVWCNAGSADPARATRQVADLVLGLSTETRPPAAAVTVAAADLEPLVGSYRDSTTDQVMTFAVRDGKPSMSGGGPWTVLTPLGGGRFWSDAAGDFRFEKEGSGWRLTRTADGVRVFARAAAFDTAQVRGADYAGTYRSEELDVKYVFRFQDGRLEARNGYRPALKLVPSYPDGFRGGPMSIRFVRDGSGRVVGARVFAGRALDVRLDRVP